MELNQKQISFYKKWEKKREVKLKFILIQGILYWALPMTISMALFKLNDVGFNLNEEIMISFLSGFAIASVLGILMAIHTYKTRDKKYLELKEKSLI